MHISKGKRYILYVSNHCVQCENVIDYLQRKSIECLIINVDNEGDTPPEKVFIYPVLFNHDKLMAYGLDIIEHFQFFDNRP
jgi:glutaredoxin